MNEELVTILQPIHEKLDRLLDTQSAIPDGLLTLWGAATLAVATVLGVVITVIAAERRQRNQLENDRDRQWKELHREKLEEALRLLLALKVWSDEVMWNFVRLSYSVEVKGGELNPDFWQIRKFIGEGETRYEMVLAISLIYSPLKNVEADLGNPFVDFTKASLKQLGPFTGANNPSDFAGLINKRKALETACNELVTEVRKVILNYKP